MGYAMAQARHGTLRADFEGREAAKRRVPTRKRGNELGGNELADAAVFAE